MNAILLSPHNDDETLFAFYQCLWFKPHVVVCLRSFREAQQGGPSFKVRERETADAMAIAGCTWEQWEYPDSAQPWRDIEQAISMIIDAMGPEVIIAPAFEVGGHEDHNEIARVARGLAHGGRLISYMTYVRGHGRSTSEHEILGDKFEQDAKFAALSCYQSQWEWPPTAPWFPGGEFSDRREWIA